MVAVAGISESAERPSRQEEEEPSRRVSLSLLVAVVTAVRAVGDTGLKGLSSAATIENARLMSACKKVESKECKRKKCYKKAKLIEMIRGRPRARICTNTCTTKMRHQAK
jgi:hypothetical protein